MQGEKNERAESKVQKSIGAKKRGVEGRNGKVKELKGFRKQRGVSLQLK
jgi:hypothetical protein